MDLGVRKCKVSLFGLSIPQQLWLRTATGSFSPAMNYKDTVMGDIFDVFQASRGTDSTVMVIPDLRHVPRLKDHPAVVERPHIKFTAAALMITQTGGGRNHALGLFSMWDTVPHPEFTAEQEAKLVLAAAATRAELQRQLFISLGMDPVAMLSGDQPPELPAVWVDLADPAWRVLGINPAWQTFMGVGLEVLERFPGILEVLVSSDGTDSATVRYTVDAAVAQLPPNDGSLAIILSPRSPTAAFMQYVMALRRADAPPPLPAASAAGADAWIIECHACLPANEYRIASSSSDDGSASRFGESRDGSVQSSEGAKGASMPTPRPVRVPQLASLTIPSIPPRMASLRMGQILGSGSYASVYAGRLGNRPVAVKIIRHAYSPDTEKDEWLDHYEALSNVESAHDNLIATLDWARIEDVGGWSVWIVQELADRGCLSAAIARGMLREGHDRRGPPDMSAILASAREIARGMRYMHSMGIIHGDLSSNNIMLMSEDNARGFCAKISDFGLSRLEGGSMKTQTVGTVSHVAPELLIEGMMSKSADVFAFGVVLWEMWTGKQAWAGMSQYQVIYALACRGDTISMPTDAPKDYAKLAMECMAPERSERPTFIEIVPRIDAMLAALGPPVPLPSPSLASLSSRGSHILYENRAPQWPTSNDASQL
jgi:hypothetical protein